MTLSDAIQLGHQDDGTFLMPATNVADLRHKLDILNRRATKLDLPTMGFEVVENVNLSRKENNGRTYILPAVRVRVLGDVPRMDGFSFIARIEHTSAGNIVARAPGKEAVELDRKWWSADCSCEHCGVNRRRYDTFIVQSSDGTVRQVGRTCLKDYTRSENVDAALRMWSLLQTFMASMSADEGSEVSGRVKLYYPTTEFLSFVVSTIRVEGWMSKKTAYELDKIPLATVNRVHWYMENKPKRYPEETAEWLKGQPTEDDVAEVADVVGWVQSLPESELSASDYLLNLRVACSLGYVEPRNMGIVASAIPAYRRAEEKKLELTRFATRPASHHVGTVGKRQVWNLTVTRVSYSESMYGTKTILGLVDDNGNDFVWFATGSLDFSAGDKVTGKGTVKEHGAYKGRPQTVLTRCAFEKTA